MSCWIRSSSRWALYLRDGLRCLWCQREILEIMDGHDFLTLDHLKHSSHGGGSDPGNLMTACWECNNARGRKSVSEFARVIEIPGSTARGRILNRRRKNSKLPAYRAQAHLALGMVKGFPASPLVVSHDALVRRIWEEWARIARGDSAPDLEAAYIDRLEAITCRECGQPPAGTISSCPRCCGAHRHDTPALGADTPALGARWPGARPTPF